MIDAARALAIATALAATSVSAEHLAGSERIEFSSDGTGEKLSGFLYLPAVASSGAKAPAVVVVHGSGGLRNVREGFWGRELVSVGFAVLAVDSFTSRGISSTVADQSRITTGIMVRDAYGALAYLAGRPQIDGTRVAVMGMSRGGAVALQSADERSFGNSGNRFAAHVPLYPGCTVQYRNPRMKSPFLVLIGANDDYTGVKSCASYVDRIRSGGASVELKVYEGAHHDFDTEGQHLMWLARAQNFRDCVVFINDDGPATLADTNEAIPLDDPRTAIRILSRTCLKMGATIAFNAEARQRALDDVKSFLKTHLIK